MSFCQNCGKEISGERFCPGCGTLIEIQNQEESTTENKNNQTDYIESINNSKEKADVNVLKLPKKFLISVCVVVIAIIVLIVAISNSGPDLEKIYENHCDAIWADVGSDGSYLSIDTNPDDVDGEGIAYYQSCVAIEEINKELGLPESLYEDMGKTTANEGKQTEEFDEIIVSWKYHPDSGLEVTYKKK